MTCRPMVLCSLPFGCALTCDCGMTRVRDPQHGGPAVQAEHGLYRYVECVGHLGDRSPVQAPDGASNKADDVRAEANVFPYVRGTQH